MNVDDGDNDNGNGVGKMQFNDLVMDNIFRNRVGKT